MLFDPFEKMFRLRGKREVDGYHMDINRYGIYMVAPPQNQVFRNIPHFLVVQCMSYIFIYELDM